MNRQYRNLLLFAFLLLLVQTGKAQTSGYVKIPTPKRTVVIEGVHVDAQGKYDTAVFRQKADIIFKTIKADAPNRKLGDGTVYLLKRNHVYQVGSMIDQPNLDIHIKGEEGAGRLPLLLHYKPNNANAAFIRGYQNTYLEDFEFEAQNSDGTFANRAIDIRGRGTRVIAKGLRLLSDRGGGLTIESTGNGMKLYMYDCIVGNGGHHIAQGGNGRALDIRVDNGSGWVDTVVFKNNTVYNLTDRIVRSMGAVVNYMEFDHNTFFNNQGYHGVIQFGNTREGVVTNNLFINPITMGDRLNRPEGTNVSLRGEQTQAANFATDADGAFAIVTHNGDLRRLKGTPENYPTANPPYVVYTDIIGVVMRNNNIFHEQEFFDVWKKYPKVFNPTVRVASDAVYTNLKGDPAQMSFTEKLTFDYNDWRNDHLGKVSSYKDLVAVTEAFAKNVNEVEFPENWSQIFPHEWNASYPTSSRSYTAADGNYPLGDLNWFPADKAKWLTGAAKSGTEVQPKSVEVPAGIVIDKVYPNPFMSDATIEYTLLNDQAVEIAVYNMFGQKVHVLQTGEMKQGSYTLKWNGRSFYGGEQPVGIYHLVFTGPSGRVSTRLMKSW